MTEIERLATELAQDLVNLEQSVTITEHELDLITEVYSRVYTMLQDLRRLSQCMHQMGPVPRKK